MKKHSYLLNDIFSSLHRRGLTEDCNRCLKNEFIFAGFNYNRAYTFYDIGSNLSIVMPELHKQTACENTKLNLMQDLSRFFEERYDCEDG